MHRNPFCKEAFRVSKSRQKKLINRKRRIQYRLRSRTWSPQDKPMLTASNIQYELSDRTRGLGSGRCTGWPGKPG